VYPLGQGGSGGTGNGQALLPSLQPLHGPFQYAQCGVGAGGGAGGGACVVDLRQANERRTTTNAKVILILSAELSFALAALL
jgi:hypothetical protein